jgi:hypothetical protein
VPLHIQIGVRMSIGKSTAHELRVIEATPAALPSLDSTTNIIEASYSNRAKAYSRCIKYRAIWLVIRTALVISRMRNFD